MCSGHRSVFISRGLSIDVQELDFNAEAANAARCAANLASPLSSIAPGQVVIPEILQELSSARVLTMEFVEGGHLLRADLCRFFLSI